MQKIFKYPRTRHIRGSGIQRGDDDIETVPFESLKGKHLVIEEKIDGANSGISFDSNWDIQLQSRGHYLTGGPREKHFNLFKQWASSRSESFLEALFDRYIMYGEWMYAKHTEFYDQLPHYWFEFDVLDLMTGEFLSTAARRELLRGLPIVSVPVVAEGKFDSLEQVKSFIKRSLYKSDSWKKKLAEAAVAQGLDPAQIATETDPSDLSEGLYIKWEDGGVVRDRYKFVRGDFVQRILDSDSHWLSRPIIQNQLAEGVNIHG